ncbi:MAG: RNA polymerase subunit sigma [Deltaproteobacteria bacterium]|nr:RNA polymerase subunit sigma [Deltaproteobacteria bacterium]
MSLLPTEVTELLPGLLADGPLLFLTGAGISAESGIPTFRGKEGYWTVGSQNYRPEELATRRAFGQMREEVWAWYLYRRSVCRAAEPNAAHHALVELEQVLGDGFLLVTQNVDGLHLRAGNTLERTYQIHGNIDFHRCWRECSPPVLLPEALGETWERGQSVDVATDALLVCEACGGPSRPHVLWFDECYDEENFRFNSSLMAIREASGLVIVGTSGATNLPTQLAANAYERGIPVIAIGPDETPFTRIAEEGPGAFLRGTATEWVPVLADALIEAST